MAPAVREFDVHQLGIGVAFREPRGLYGVGKFRWPRKPHSVTRGGISTDFSFNALRYKTYESLPGSGSGNTFGRDMLGRVTSVHNSDGSSRSYTYSGNSVSVTDERGHTTTYRFAAFGDPDQRMLTGIDLPEGRSISIGRNDVGNITSVSQGSITRSYGYTGSYFLSTISDPETGSTSFGRDGLGNMTSMSVGGRTISYTYDGLSRLIGISYPDGESTSISYYGDGKTSTVTNRNASISYTYDSNRNLTGETMTVDGNVFTTSYSYSGTDALSSISYPRGQGSVSYAPDALGRPNAASPYLSSVSHFRSGNLSSMRFANGVSASFGEPLLNSEWVVALAARQPRESYPLGAGGAHITHTARAQWVTPGLVTVVG